MAHFTAGVGIIDMDIAQDMMMFDKGRGIPPLFFSPSLILGLSSALFPLNPKLIELELPDYSLHIWHGDSL